MERGRQERRHGHHWIQHHLLAHPTLQRPKLTNTQNSAPRTLWSVPEDGPHTTKTCLGLGSGPVPCLSDPKQGGDGGLALMEGWELQLQTQQLTGLPHAAPKGFPTHRNALASFLAQPTRQNEGEESGCGTEAALPSTVAEGPSAAGGFKT